MKWRTFEIQSEPGFRFNLLDLIILTSLALISYVTYLFSAEGYLFLLPLYVGLTFFLFCNVFRIGNRLEPFWYVPFVAAVAYGFYHPAHFWAVVIGVCEPLKLILILYRMVKGPYRGVFYRKVNKRLNRGR